MRDFLAVCFWIFILIAIVRGVTSGSSSSRSSDYSYQPSYGTDTAAVLPSYDPIDPDTTRLDTNIVDSTVLSTEDAVSTAEAEDIYPASSAPDFDALQAQLDRLKSQYAHRAASNTYDLDKEVQRLRDEFNRLSNDYSTNSTSDLSISSYNLVDVDAELRKIKQEFSGSNYSSLYSTLSVDRYTPSTYSLPTLSTPSYYSTNTNSNHVYVDGYYRSNGTYVQGHYRTAPNATTSDNFSSYPNINPYTGQVGTKRN